MAKFEITWDAPEFEYREKGVSWYWISIILAAFLIGFAVWQKDFLFGLFIVLAEILVIVWGDRPPRIMRFTLTDEMLQLGGHRLHFLRDFETWSTDRDDEWADIHFYFRSRIRPPLRVILPAERVDEIRAKLGTVLKEIQHDMSVVDAIERILHF